VGLGLRIFPGGGIGNGGARPKGGGGRFLNFLGFLRNDVSVFCGPKGDLVHRTLVKTTHRGGPRVAFFAHRGM